LGISTETIENPSNFLDYSREMKRSSLLLIFLVIFFDLLSFGIVIPILPYYSKNFGASAFALGWLMASYSIAQFLFAPVWGALSDRFGRRPILLFTILGSAGAMLLTGLADNLYFLFAARILAGFFAANISTATAYITDITPPEQRAKGMGIVGAGYGLGFIFGPAIGGVLSVHSYALPILCAAGLALFNFFFALLFLAEPEKKKGFEKKFQWQGMSAALAQEKTAFPIGLFFLSTLAFTQLEVVFGLFVLEKFSFGPRDAGWLLAGMGIVSAFLQGGLIGRLAKKFGESYLLITGFFFFSFSLIGASFAPSVGMFAISLLGIAVGSGLVNPSLSSLASKGAPEDKRGLIMGMYQSAGSFARIVGPPAAGYIFDRWNPSSPIFFSGLLMGLGFFLALLGKKRFA
jgi:DHA1 family tetracycline resistance protein-like MFS transporter